MRVGELRIELDRPPKSASAGAGGRLLPRDAEIVPRAPPAPGQPHRLAQPHLTFDPPRLGFSQRP